MKRVLAVVAVVLFVTSGAASQEVGLSLSGADTLASGELPCGTSVCFRFRLSNLSSEYILLAVNGFRVYSPDGATWHPGISRVDTVQHDWPPYQTIDTSMYIAYLDNSIPAVYGFDGWGWIPEHLGGPYIWGYMPRRVISGDGAGADSLGVAGNAIDMGGSGIPPGFVADPAIHISIASIDSASIGRTLCIDSCFVPDFYSWQWYGDEWIVPDWDGPHCFVIGDCCIGLRGNFDYSNMDIDIADLTGLVSYMFGGGFGISPCLLAANVNGDSQESADISDLTYMIAYMFRGGPQPPACP